jgi:hypothetical protein
MGVEASRERIEARIDMIETSIHAVEPGIGPRRQGVDARSQVNQRSEGHGSEDSKRGPDGGIHLSRAQHHHVTGRRQRSEEADIEIDMGRRPEKSGAAGYSM